MQCLYVAGPMTKCPLGSSLRSRCEQGGKGERCLLMGTKAIIIVIFSPSVTNLVHL